MPKVIQVIESEVNRGKGTLTEPFRHVTQYHTLDGVLLAEKDQLGIDGVGIAASTHSGQPPIALYTTH